MAQMIPSVGPAKTDSAAERRIYHILKKELSNDFVVIHSLPWLCASVRAIDRDYPPTGEIDFLIVHEVLGILAVEVKGGVHRTEGATFVHIKSGRSSHPVRQARKNAHGLARWLGHDPNLRFRIGYGFIFPDSSFGDQVIDAAMVDVSVSPRESIFVDKNGMADLGLHIQRIMRFWQAANSSVPLGSARKAKLVQTLCPEFDGTPSWASRIEYDNRMWLRLTQEQSRVVDTAVSSARLVVSGWPGTGKTLIGIELARRLAVGGQRVLGLTLNNLLAKHWRAEIEITGGVVSTWHSFCFAAARKLHGDVVRNQEWMDTKCLDDLLAADRQGLVPQFDALIIDEAQTLKPMWCDWLARHFEAKKIVVFCDETQIFAFEKERVSVKDLCKFFGTTAPFSLTIPLRSPKVVTDHLLRIKTPTYQVFSPRDLEPDALQERVVTDVSKTVDLVLTELEAQGLRREDVVVLSKYAAVAEYQGHERYETVSRFRGLESPAIVIAWAEMMDDVELFCAYSRATTVCVALYDAEKLGFQAPSGRFHELILAEPRNAELAQETSEQASTRFIISNHVQSVPLSLQSASIRWCPSWGAWLVDRQDNDEAAELWIDYLVCHHRWPVYAWTEKSRREVQFSMPVDDADRGNGGSPHRLGSCEDCNAVVPFQRAALSDTWHCQACVAKSEDRGEPTSQLFDLLREYDKLLCSGTSENKDELVRLPLSLAALGARRLARKNDGYQCNQLEMLPTGTIVFRAAMAFVYARISLLSEGTLLVLDRLAEATGRYVLPPGVTATLWRNRIALSLGRSYTQGLLVKDGKGRYKISRPSKP